MTKAEGEGEEQMARVYQIFLIKPFRYTGYITGLKFSMLKVTCLYKENAFENVGSKLN